MIERRINGGPGRRHRRGVHEIVLIIQRQVQVNRLIPCGRPCVHAVPERKRAGKEQRQQHAITPEPSRHWRIIYTSPMIGRLVCGLAVVFFFIQLLFVDHLPIPGTRWEANDPWTGLAFVAAVALFFQWRRCRATRESFYSTRNLFWLVLFVYLSNFRWHGSDDLPASLLPFGLLRSGTFSLDR